MSEDADPELLALRNELLTGLNKKSSKNDLINENLTKMENDLNIDSEDDELERLRLEALQAKRAKNEINLKHKLPGRFRYDRESDGEEEDDLDYDALITSHDKEFEESDEEESSGIKKEFHNNYKTYRDECSKLMSNDAYEPDTIDNNHNTTLNNFDLRRLLKNRANHEMNKNQRENISNSNQNENLDDLDYVYEPITEPIILKKNEIYYNNHYNNKRNNQKNYEERKYLNNYNHNKSKYEQDANEEEYEEEDEDEFTNKRKLKSIVIVKKNDYNKLDESKRSSNDSYRSYSNYYRRRRYSSSSSR